jgi:hypothetical protein
MLMFGGRYRVGDANPSDPYTLFGDLWEFSFSNQTWNLLDDGQGTAPDPRFNGAAAYDPTSDTFYVYGGGTGTNPLNVQPNREVWAYNSNAWSEVIVAGNPPSFRLYTAYAYDSSRNRLVAYGGQVGDFLSPALGDLHVFDFDDSQWTRLHTGDGIAPEGRFSAMMLYDATRDRYVMTGGHVDGGVANDVWEFDPTALSWSEIVPGDLFTGAALGCLGNPRELPANYVTEDLASPERRSGAVFVQLEGKYWLFGGESDCSDHLDDTWTYDVATSHWAKLIPARFGESCARKNQACTCLCL